MSKVTFQLKSEAVRAEPPTLSSIPILRPALVVSNGGKRMVMIKVPCKRGGETFLALEDGSSLMWASQPEMYTFVRYLSETESVTIPGMGGGF